MSSDIPLQLNIAISFLFKKVFKKHSYLLSENYRHFSGGLSFLKKLIDLRGWSRAWDT